MKLVDALKRKFGKNKNTMTNVNLNSSAIKSASFDEATSVLSLTFKSGKTASYKNVPKSVAEGLISSPSAGRYFNATIRDKFAVAA